MRRKVPIRKCSLGDSLTDPPLLERIPFWEERSGSSHMGMLFDQHALQKWQLSLDSVQESLQCRWASKLRLLILMRKWQHHTNRHNQCEPMVQQLKTVCRLSTMVQQLNRPNESCLKLTSSTPNARAAVKQLLSPFPLSSSNLRSQESKPVEKQRRANRSISLLRQAGDAIKAQQINYIFYLYHLISIKLPALMRSTNQKWPHANLRSNKDKKWQDNKI